MKKLIIAFTVFALSIIADAKVVAWYRFEEQPSGTVTTGETVFKNEVDPSKYPAYARVCTANGNNKFNPSSPTVLNTSNVDRMPIYRSAFPENIALYDNVGFNGGIGGEYSNNRALNLRNLPDNNANPSGLVLIDDHEDLHLKSFTLEFFMRAEDSTIGWRTLAVKSASKYSSKEPFRIFGQLYKTGGMYLLCELRTFGVTNMETQVAENLTYKFTASHTDAIVDDNLWHHIALVVNDETKEAKVYIDYVLRATQKYVGDFVYEEGYPFVFGGDVQCSYFNMDMSVDEIRISDEPLPSSKFLQYGYKRESSSINAIDENTLFFFDFNDSQTPVVLGEGEMKKVQTRVPFYVNKATYSPYRDVDVVLYNHSANYVNYATPTRNTKEIPNEGSRFGLLGESSTENTASCHIITNSPDNDQSSRIVLPSSITREMLFGESLTIEGYFMVPSKSIQDGFSFKKGTGDIIFCMNGSFNIQMVGKTSAWSYGYLMASVGGVSLQNNGYLPAHPSLSRKTFADGKWHHFALVYDKAAGESYFYLDNVMHLSGVTPTPYSPVNNSYVKQFILGDSYWGDHYSTNFRFDEIRITRGALRPYQFLTTIPIENVDDYASASFENNFVMAPYTNFFGEAGTPSVFTENGKTPVLEKMRPARILTLGKKGTELTDSNTYSLRIDGGQVLYSNRALMAESDEFTVQFFMKPNSINEKAGIARINRTSTTLVTEEVTWALSFADSDGNLSLKVDTDARAGQTHVFQTAVASNVWSHIGMQFITENGNTAVKLYKDYELIDTWTLDGKIVTRPRLMNFMLGAGEDSTVGFDGWIDEFRLTPGIVPASSFIYPVRVGSLILVK